MADSLTAQQAFEQMMRGPVAAGLRELGLRGTFREFRYTRERHSASIRWRKSWHNDRQQVDFELEMTGGPVWAFSLRSLMPGAVRGYGWQLRADQQTGPLARGLVAAVRRYGRPAMLAMTDDGATCPQGGWPRAFPPIGDFYEDLPGHGIDPAAWYVQPAGVPADGTFTELTDGRCLWRQTSIHAIGEGQLTDGRAVPALLDRLEREPRPQTRLIIAARFLAPLAGDPAVRAALEAAAGRDPDAGVRWAARYALLLDTSA